MACRDRAGGEFLTNLTESLSGTIKFSTAGSASQSGGGRQPGAAAARIILSDKNACLRRVMMIYRRGYDRYGHG